MKLSKEEFFYRYSLEGSMAILALNQNDDEGKWLYEALLDYRSKSLEEFLEQKELENEQEFLELVLCKLDEMILTVRHVKKFIKQRKKYI